MGAAAPAVMLGLLLLAPAAGAHPSLVQSSPPAGVVVDGAPARIVLSFSEEVVLRGSRLELRRLTSRGAGSAVPRVGAVGRRGRAGISAPLRGRLAAGVYELRWAVLGVDGHVVGGPLLFGVARPDGRPPAGIEQLGPAAGPSARDAAAGSEDPATVLSRWAGLLAGALLLGGTLLRTRLRRLGDGDARWTRVVLPALVLGVASAVAGAIAATAPAAGGGFDLLLLTANGQIALAR
ncbi:MAG: copper transport protein, partial [Solirubrobacteraceae bacterium]|nr:copper transport protein [Solirubrobacteraceae bacterium]